ncbi:MAG TPA: hypothetical protein VFO63_09660 [Blastocatellia bacterium]|nr:hypothetical protein [Blastocatellia bacterium]
MPITQAGDPPGDRVLTRRLGDAVGEEEIREWSPNGVWVKMRVDGNPSSDRWQRKDEVDQRWILKLDDDPPVIP